MSERYDDYKRLKFDWPEERILRVTMDNPGRLNSADAVMHGELVRVWRDIDADPQVNAVIIRGAGNAFSSGGDLDLVKEMTEDFGTLTRVWKEARDLVYNIINCSKPLVSAMEGPAVGAGLVAGVLADISIAGKTARIIDGHTRLGVAAGDHAAIVWPLLCGMAKAIDYLMLAKGEVVAMSYHFSHPSITFEPLAKGRLVCIASKDHPVAAKNRISAREIVEHPLIGIDPRDPYGAIMASIFERENLAYDISIRARFGTTVCALVKRNLGIAVIDAFTVADMQDQGLAVIPIAEDTVFQTYVAYRSDAALSSYAERFVKVLRQAMDDHIAAPRTSANT